MMVMIVMIMMQKYKSVTRLWHLFAECKMTMIIIMMMMKKDRTNTCDKFVTLIRLIKDDGADNDDDELDNE